MLTNHDSHASTNLAMLDFVARKLGELNEKVVFLGGCTTALFVSHVSPGKEPLLTRLIIHFMPNIWISGHMGAPYPCIWNQFTIREMNESLEWLESQLQKLDALPVDKLTPEAKIAYELMKREIPRKEFWFKKLWNINLPDAKDGYVVLTYSDGRFFVESCCSIVTS